MNYTIINNKPYKLICIWRDSKKDKTVDDKGDVYPYPKKENQWSGQLSFLEQLKVVQKYLIKIESNTKLEKTKSCIICGKEDIITERYNLGKFIWDDGLYHYIKHHNIKPPDEFVDKIWNTEIFVKVPVSDEQNLTSTSSNSENNITQLVPQSNTIELSGKIKIKNNNKFLKLGRNQLMILDALMKHGGYNKKYYDTKNKDVIRYSEHAGFIDIKGRYVENIIVSGNTLRVDRGDEEIFLPMNSADTYNYKYIFHTHPPTPKPGGRANDGILYEFPSIGDILHFIDHHNDGDTIGSLVMTPEGLYNIRKISIDTTKIEINEDDMYNEIRKVQRKAQDLALKEYGEKFSTYTFYSKISQDTKFINMINDKLNKYNLAIDYYPRTKDFKGSWVVDTIYVPIF